jgi:hypothetical protein
MNSTNDTTETNAKAFPHQLARAAWLAGVIAVGIVIFTSRTPAKLVGEIAALILVGVGLLSGVVALATIPQYGFRNIFSARSGRNCD